MKKKNNIFMFNLALSESLLIENKRVKNWMRH